MPELDIGMTLSHGFKSLAKDKLNKQVGASRSKQQALFLLF
jgi:hypothetical protein